MFFDDIDPAPSVIPVPNLGGMLDIPNGNLEYGIRGEAITNGGLQHITAIVAEGNVGKTLLLCHMMTMLLAHYIESSNLVYENENNFKKVRQRISALTNCPDLLYSEDEIASLGNVDENDLKRSKFTTIANYWGDEIYESIRKKILERMKDKKQLLETPFMNHDGKPIKIFPFANWGIDSFSMFKASNQQDFNNKSIGSSKRNMENMKDGGVKAQLLRELPSLTTKGGLTVIMTAHIGKEHQIDPMKPVSKILAYLAQGKKIKDVSEKFLFIPQNVILMYGVKTMWVSSSDKTCYYPRHGASDETKSLTDLQTVNIISLRNKAGISGAPYELVCSQTEGYLPTLSEFHYCKTNNRFGIIGNGEYMSMVFYPEVKFTRNTIRGLIKSDPKLCCAIRLTSEILQITRYWPLVAEEVYLTPEEIYTTIKEKGYDWDELLQTRGHWTFDQYTNPVKFLSGMDLLNICRDLYIPYWKQDKKSTKKK